MRVMRNYQLERSRRGFTIVELMVSLAVAAILLGFAIPAFNDFIVQRTMTSRINDFVVALGYARSEAARRGEVVRVQSLDASDNANEWGPGYRVITADGTVLRSFEPMDDATLDGQGDFQGVGELGFNGRGMLTVRRTGSVLLCSTDVDEDPGRAVDIAAIGRATVRDVNPECHP